MLQQSHGEQRISEQKTIRFEDVTHRSFAAWKKPYKESWLPAFFSWDKQLLDFTACVSSILLRLSSAEKTNGFQLDAWFVLNLIFQTYFNEEK